MTTKTKMIAINSIQICDGIESDVTGYREDGSPITKLRRLIVEPGEMFEIADGNVARLVDQGVATTDLTWVAPRLVEGGQ